MSHCQQFRQQIEKWKKELEEVKVLLGEYLESGKEERAEEMKKKIENIADEQRDFLQHEFTEKVKKLLKKWCPLGYLRNYLNNVIELTQQGRVRWRGDLNLFGKGEVYFPVIIESINNEILDLRSTRIRKLDHLKEIAGTLRLDSTFFDSARGLCRIGGALYLEDVSIKKTFRAVFPSLIKVGRDPMGTSIVLSPRNEHLKQEIEELVAKGELEMGGKIWVQKQ